MLVKKTLSQKAVMFGLDARIALAIFGALSIITGTVLYNTIKQIKITAFAETITEIAKAYEQYYLDTGSHMPRLSDNVHLDIYELTSSSKTDWKGPYFNFAFSDGEGLTHAYHKNHINGKALMVVFQTIKKIVVHFALPKAQTVLFGYVFLIHYILMKQKN